MIVDKARKTSSDYFLRVLVNPDETNEDDKVYEEFHWGLDVPLAVIKRETKAILEQKYGSTETKLALEGKVL